MAVTGRFGADFSDFQTAVQQSEAQLRSFETSAAKVQTRLNTVSDSFSGRRILSEATIAVKAVEEVGGATALTATEQERVNRLVSEAIAKYEALGKEAPADMLALRDATKGVHEPAEGINTKMIALGTSIGTMAASAVTALGRLAVEGIGKAATAFGDLVMEGSEVGDISGNFDHLATSAGHVAETLLGQLRAGTHQTINDLELMKVVNQDLAAGVNLTDQQFGTLAQGAFALAQATGGDVKQGLDAMNDAMLTGQTRAIQLLTGKIDLESAERRYALAMGKTRDELTEEDKLRARQAAILDAVSAATARLGEQTDGIDEKVAQARVQWDNFRMSLAQSIADSPVLAAGLDQIAASLLQAFGGNQEALITKIVGAINSGAIMAADFGIALVEMAKVGASALGVLEVPLNAVAFGILDLVTRVAEGMATMQEMAASVPGVGKAFEGTAVQARDAANAWGEMRDKAQQDLETSKALATGKSELHGWLTKLGAGIGEVKSSMEAANLTTKAAGDAVTAHTQATAANADAQTNAARASNDDAEALRKQEAALKAARAEQEKMAAAMAELGSVGDDWLATINALDQGVADMARAYIEAGASQGAIQTALGLTDGQFKALKRSVDEYHAALKAGEAAQAEWKKKNEEATKDAGKLWEDFDRLRTSQSSTATNAQIADIERWKQGLITKYTEAGHLTEDLYDAIEATAEAKLDAVRVDWGALGSASKEHLQEIADKAQATYAEALSGSRTFSIEAIDNFRRTAEEAQTAADNYGTAWETNAGKASDAVNKAADDSIAAQKRVQLGTVGTQFGLGMKGGSFTLPGGASLNGVPRDQWETRAADAGGVVRYDDYGNPFIYTGTGPEGVADPGWSRLRFKGAPSGPLDAMSPFIGAMGSWMADGGPVSAGRPYVVGERGPEVFVPSSGGRIIPNGGMGGVSVTVVVQGAVLGTQDQLAALVGDAIVNRLRRQGVRLPTEV